MVMLSKIKGYNNQKVANFILQTKLQGVYEIRSKSTIVQLKRSFIKKMRYSIKHNLRINKKFLNNKYGVQPPTAAKHEQQKSIKGKKQKI